MTRVTLLALRQRVQTATFLGVPLTRTRIFWTFALKRRRVRRCEWEMLFPNPGVLPQISHTEAITAGRVPQRKGPRRLSVGREPVGAGSRDT